MLLLPNKWADIILKPSCKFNCISIKGRRHWNGSV